MVTWINYILRTHSSGVRNWPPCFLLFACELMHILYIRKTPARTTLNILGAVVKKKKCCPGQGFLHTWTWLQGGRLGCDFSIGHAQVFQTGTVSSSTLQFTHLASVYQELFLPFIFMVGSLLRHVGKFNFPQPSPLTVQRALIEEIQIFVFYYPHWWRYVTYSELLTKYMWESCKNSFLDIKLVHASRTVLWSNLWLRPLPRDTSYVMDRALMNFILWLTTIQNSFRNTEIFLDIYRISDRVDHRTTQLTKKLGVVDTSKEFRTYVGSFQAVYDLRSFSHVISCNPFIINVYWGIYIHTWTLLQKQSNMK